MSKAKQILNRLNEMSRGLIVLDHDLLGLRDSLKDKNIRVVIPDIKHKDYEIKHRDLGHRIFVTNNSQDFIDDAVPLEYGIIATEKIKSKDPKILADIISKAITKFDIWSKPFGFILVLKPDGKHIFRLLPK